MVRLAVVLVLCSWSCASRPAPRWDAERMYDARERLLHMTTSHAFPHGDPLPAAMAEEVRRQCRGGFEEVQRVPTDRGTSFVFRCVTADDVERMLVP